MTLTPPLPSAQPAPAAPNPYAIQEYGATVVFAPSPPRGLSIASMILGIVGIVGFAGGGGLLSVLAVIFGHIGIRKEPAGRGMAIAGLVTGYIGVGLSVILLAFLIVVPLILIAIAGTVAVGTSGLPA